MKSVVTGKLPSLLSVVGTIRLNTVSGKPTKECCTSPMWAFRSKDIDNLLPAVQSKAGPCVITALDPSRRWTLTEVAATTILAIDARTNNELLGTLLIHEGHTMTLSQAEKMAEQAERGEKTILHINGDGNFFFLETGDPKNPVLVGDIYRGQFGWCAVVDGLVSTIRGNGSVRFLVRNLV